MLYCFTRRDDIQKSSRSTNLPPSRSGVTKRGNTRRTKLLLSCITAPGLSQILIAMLLILLFAANGVGAAGTTAQQTVRQANRQQAEELTMKLVKLMSSYQQAGKTQKVQLQKELINITKNRQQLLAEMVQNDPASALRAVLPEKIRSHMPVEVQTMLEQKKVLKGELEVSYEDYADSRYKLRHVLTTESGRFELKLPAQAKHFTPMQSGMQVSARGWLFAHGGETEGSLVVNDSQEGLELLANGAPPPATTAISTGVLPNTTGEQNVLVLMVNFQDNQAEPWTTAEAEQLVFGTVNDFFQENSNGQTWLAGDVAGFYTLPITETCNKYEIENYAKQVASANGIDISSYNRLLYMFPRVVDCGWAALGTVGGNPSRAWINGELNLRAIGHELGHNYGLYHAQALECGTETIGSSCTNYSYGDTMDIMGSATGHLNAFNKEQLGWLLEETGELVTADTEGTYLLEPYESAPTGKAKGLKLQRGVDPVTGSKLWYYLEYRQALGFDDFLESKPDITGGVILHLATELDRSSSQLIDIRPDSIHSDLADTALSVGDSYTDTDAGVTITTEWADATGASVRIDYSEQSCIQANPELFISPVESTWVEAGSTVAYTATVINYDTLGCSASDFNIATELPIGWTADSAILNLEPGTNGTATLNVTSPTVTADGFYDIVISATNSTNGNYQSGDTVTYVVDSPVSICSTANPLLSASASDGEPVVPGTEVTYSVTVTNQDSSGCNPAIFQIAAAVPEGWSSSSESVSLAAGESANVEISVISATNAAAGTYQVPISVKNSQDNSLLANATVTHTIAPMLVCEPANPQLELSVNSNEEIAAGAIVQYTGTLTNQNSLGCADSDFKLSATVPNGWTATSQSLSLAAGASSSFTLNVTSAPGAEEGAYSISITAENAADATYSTSVPANYLITMPVNNALQAVDDSVSLPTKSAITIDVLANDSGREGGKLEIVQVTQGSQGSVQINSDGSLLYTPVKNFKDSDSFIYTVSDGESTATATVTVTLTNRKNGKLTR